MPFGGYPVFRHSPRGQSVKTGRSSRRLPCTSRALPSRLPAALQDFQLARVANEASRTLFPADLPPPSACADEDERNATALLSISCSTAHEAPWTRPALRQVPRRSPKRTSQRMSPGEAATEVEATPGFTRRGLPPPARSPLIAFLRFQRAAPFWSVPLAPTGVVAFGTRQSAHEADRVCLTPATLLSFRLQGFAPPGDPDPSPGLILPCRWGWPRPLRRLRRVDPSGEAARTDIGRTAPSALLAFSPLRLSLSPP
jgi:hypothetical protein